MRCFDAINLVHWITVEYPCGLQIAKEVSIPSCVTKEVAERNTFYAKLPTYAQVLKYLSNLRARLVS
jgi:hypothetical protein